MGTAAGTCKGLQFAESLKTCPYNERAQFSGDYNAKLVSPLPVLTTNFNLDTELVQEAELVTKIVMGSFHPPVIVNQNRIAVLLLSFLSRIKHQK